MRAFSLVWLLALAARVSAGQVPLILPGGAACPLKPVAAAPLTVAPAALDGLPVAPQLRTLEQMRQAAAEQNSYLPGLMRDVARALPALERSVAKDQWNGPNTTLDTPCCGDAAPKLAAMLRAAGHDAHLVEAEFHYYVLVQLAKGRLVVDPTFRQFFGGASAPASVPRVFVGGYEDLHALLEKRRAERTSSFSFSRIYFSDAKIADSKMPPAPDFDGARAN